VKSLDTGAFVGEGVGVGTEIGPDDDGSAMDANGDGKSPGEPPAAMAAPVQPARDTTASPSSALLARDPVAFR
jgi:hypothetical protein